MRSRTIREGSVGLLILFGFILFGGLFIWLRGFKVGQQSYNITIAFRNANRVIAGSPVRYRGVNVGEVVSINPNANGVDIEVEINRVDLSIPRENLLVEANQSGLIGETSIDIYPQVELASNQGGINPLSEDCNSQLIVCQNDTIQGEVGASLDVLIRNTAEAAELISDPELFNNLKNVARSATEAADGIAEVSRELSIISGDVSQQLKVLTTTTSEQLRVLTKTTEKTGEQVTATAAEAERLIRSVNRLVVANEKNVETTLPEISATSQQLSQLVETVVPTLETINSNLDAADTEELIRNLETLTANAAATSENLKKASSTFSDPENLVLLQQTLDSARATFENTQKITSDLDELTGNPEFRQDLEDLIKGLSELLSSTQELEQQLAIAETNHLELKKK
ncbi:MAG: MlaD family protein [Halothece sp. Uz-M2-17]|nr:MlaD family protein [Halothece sp. Uz-M2-17]